MRIPLALSLMLVSASAVGAQEVRINLEAYREPVLMDTLRQNRELKASPAKVYEATLKAFAALEIPVGNTVGTAGIIGSERFYRMRTLGGELLSRSFFCGEDPTGPNADSHRLEIAVVAYVAAWTRRRRAGSRPGRPIPRTPTLRIDRSARAKAAQQDRGARRHLSRSTHRIRTLSERAIVISFRADDARERAPR
jgi:hypothetical protein